MRKLSHFVVCCMLCVVCCIVSGCGKKDEEKLNALKGTWIKDETQHIGINVTFLEFSDKNNFNYKIRVYNWNDNKNEFEEGFHIYKGTYKLKDNIIYLDITQTDNSFPLNECGLCNPTPPPKKLIVDFNKMKICNRDDGIDCQFPFSKDANN